MKSEKGNECDTDTQSMQQKIGLQEINWNPFSFATCSWITPLVVQGAERPLEDTDLPKLGHSKQGTGLKHYLDPFWNDSSNTLLLKCILSSVWTDFLCSIILEWIFIIIDIYAIPLILHELLTSLTSADSVGSYTKWTGQNLGLIFFLLQVIMPLLDSAIQSNYRVMTLKIQSITMGALYKKHLQLSGKSKIEYTDGQVINLINTDAVNIAKLFTVSNDLWTIPVKLIFSCYQLYTYLGASVWSTTGLIIASLILTLCSGRIMAPWFGEWFKAIDQRLSKTREILLAMRIIKYKGYEDFFRSVIHNLRKLEVIIFRKLATAQLINQGFTNTFPAMIPVSAFLIYSSMGNPLTPDVVFPCLSLFVSLQNPLYQATMVITSFAKYYYSWIRVCSFMNAAEVQQRLKDKSIQSHILIQDGVFKHHTADSTDDSTESAFQLESLSIDIQPGSLIGIVGSVGAGKSSLLSAIMGQMNLKSGELIVNGSLAYCQQQPWIQSGTLRDNILFTSELNNQKLNECIDVCGMSADLLQLPDGINTELGENGITLSGGQKSRLALARAIYKNSDIYLLDDPLASLDSKVCLSVFENAILRKLKSKTVLLVTHQLHLMKRVDKILVLKEGKLVGFGKYDELKSNNDYFRDLTADYEIGEVGDVALDSGANGESAISDYSSDVGSGKKVIEEEERIKGKTKKETIFEFIKSMGVGFLSFNVFSFLCSIGFSISQNLYLTQQTEKPTVENSFFVTYALLGLGQSIAAVGMYNLFFASVYIAQKLHKKALIGIFGAPISFFDSQPVGRILNRFSSDLMGVNMMCNTGIYLTGSIVALITTTILISQANAMLLLLLVVLSISFWHLYNFFQKSNIELQRITSIRKSPVDSHVSVSISGNDTICCFGLQNQYFESFLRKVDDYLTAEYLRATLRIWVFLRMSVLSSLITATVLIILFCFPEQMGGVGSVGLSLVNAVGFSTSMFKFLLYLGEAESELNAFERLSFYGNSLPKESEYVLPSDPTKDDWPINGKVEFENVELSYAANLDRPVIKNVTVTFNAGEKIGVCGRTGSGKSTFASAFFRMVDITNGTIKIDGKDISKIGLHTLRSRVEMIPQEPILFNGTWRFNLDIEDKYSDHEIWNALDLVGLKQQLWDSSDKLSTEITDGGENLSFGQRQLLCLARAILSSPKILIMDEATSSIDSESDQLIQTILKVHFKDTTVISIAHRLNTIAAFDKVLVLDDGNLMEFDSPSNLINRNGIFAELVSATGPLNEAVIRGIIKKEQS